MDMKKIVMAATLVSIVTGGEVSALAAKTQQSVAKFTHVKVTKHKVTGYTTAKSHIELLKLKHREKSSTTANKHGKFTLTVKHNNLTKLNFKLKATKAGLKARTYTHKAKSTNNVGSSTSDSHPNKPITPSESSNLQEKPNKPSIPSHPNKPGKPGKPGIPGTTTPSGNTTTEPGKPGTPAPTIPGGNTTAEPGQSGTPAPTIPGGNTASNGDVNVSTPTNNDKKPVNPVAPAEPTPAQPGESNTTNPDKKPVQSETKDPNA